MITVEGDAAHRGEFFFKEFQGIVRAGIVRHHDFRIGGMLHHAGQELPEHFGSVPIEDDDGNVAHLFGVWDETICPESASCASFHSPRSTGTMTLSGWSGVQATSTRM